MILLSPTRGFDPFGLFEKTEVIKKIEDVTKDHCLILWGGEDIGTSIYGQKPNRYCHNYKTSARDVLEINLVKQAVKVGAPIIGICRGAQLMCALFGGSIMQHIEDHIGGTHNVTLHDENDTVIQCNSAHHQMLLPPENAKVLASAKCTVGVGENNVAHKIDSVPEVVYFPMFKSIGIQSHPEWPNQPVDFMDYCRRKIKEYIL